MLTAKLVSSACLWLAVRLPAATGCGALVVVVPRASAKWPRVRVLWTLTATAAGIVRVVPALPGERGDNPAPVICCVRLVFSAKKRRTCSSAPPHVNRIRAQWLWRRRRTRMLRRSTASPRDPLGVLTTHSTNHSTISRAIIRTCIRRLFRGSKHPKTHTVKQRKPPIHHVLYIPAQSHGAHRLKLTLRIMMQHGAPRLAYYQ